jgi:hypothetical protein
LFLLKSHGSQKPIVSKVRTGVADRPAFDETEEVPKAEPDAKRHQHFASAQASPVSVLFYELLVIHETCAKRPGQHPAEEPTRCASERAPDGLSARLQDGAGGDCLETIGLVFFDGSVAGLAQIKNPTAPAVKREAAQDWAY